MRGAVAHFIHFEALGRGRRETYAFFATFFLTAMSTYMTIVFIPLYALKFTANLGLVSLLTTAYYIAFTASLPIYGRLSDRKGAYATFTILGTAATSLSCLAIPAVRSYLELAAVRAVQGVSWALVAPMGAAMASLSTTRTLRGRAMSVFNLSVSSGYLAGSIAAGVVSELWGMDSVFILGGLTSAAASITAILGLRGWRVAERPRSRVKLRLRRVKPVYVGFALRNVGATGIWALFPIYLASLGASDLWIGILYMVNLASQSLLMGYVGSLTDKWGRKPVFLMGLFGSSTVFALYGLSKNYLWIIPIHVLLGLSWNSLITASTAYIGDEAPGEAHGAMMSLLFTVTGLAWIAGSSLAAGLVGLIGLRKYMFVAAAFSALGGLYGLVYMEESLGRVK